jgi:hypothetical protein
MLKREKWVVTKEIAASVAGKAISEHADHPSEAFPGKIQV